MSKPMKDEIVKKTDWIVVDREYRICGCNSLIIHLDVRHAWDDRDRLEELFPERKPFRIFKRITRTTQSFFKFMSRPHKAKTR